VVACTCAAARRLYFNCLFFRLAIIGICLIERLLRIVFFSFLRVNLFFKLARS
jgi:hypothetical protein